jgi:anti-sigma factor RsiW
VNDDAKLLLGYVDGELSPLEAERFRARLAESPELRQRLSEMRRVGGLVRLWADDAQARAGSLLEPTLERVSEAQRRRNRTVSIGFALGALLVMALPSGARSSLVAPAFSAPAASLQPPIAKPAGAAIERIEAGDKQAQVFVVGDSSTPVVWLLDDDAVDDDTDEQDPG